MSRTYTFDEIYMAFDVAYSTKEDRTAMGSVEVRAKTIDKALALAKKKINRIEKDNDPIITSIEFMEYVNSKGHILCVMEDGERWEREEDWHNRSKKIAEERLRKEMEKPVDKSCWYINPFDPNKRVFNQNGDIVELNTFHSEDDYKFFKELHLKDDTVMPGYGSSKYKTVCPYLYECIVYGHNLRYGHIKERSSSLTDAIYHVRIQYTKLSLKDDPRGRSKNDENSSHL